VIKVCQRLVAGQWFSLSTTVSSTNKTDRRDIANILLKVALNTLTPSLKDCRQLFSKDLAYYHKCIHSYTEHIHYIQKIYTCK
jgi:hypothetical protein